ncbi:alkylation response protein AidB-like acyl-CoA dehydrogenase [Sphingomonas zeicaulis]|uniref:acyl-CoA dehydrogenase n=1 Tax=Sphingomonas zeicaulis TaxID=1632740 RepID=UPI003D231D72
MTYTPPVAEQRFVLEHVVGIAALAADARYEAASPDMVDAILEGAGAFAAGEYAPLNRIGDTEGARWEDGRVILPAGFREAYQAFVAGGWGSLNGPESYGGQGLPYALAAAVMEDLGSANMGFSLVNMLTPGAIEALIAYGTDDQKAKWLPKLITGEWTGTMNLTEPQAGSDVGALRTTAAQAADGSWRIKGTKIFITFGEHELADNILHLVLARTPGAPAGTRGISLFLVPKLRDDGTPNDVRCVSIEHKLGIHASPTCVMSYGDHDDCHGELIGAEHGGIAAMFVMMNNARLNVGLQGVQIGERATQQAVAYAVDRVQSARAGAPSREPVPIIEHPDVRRMLLRMKALTQGARALVYYAIGQLDRAHLGDEAARDRVELLTPLAKSWGTDAGCEIASLGVQVHGGMGFIEETGAAQHYRDIRIAPIYEGTNGIQAADLVGRKLALGGGAPFDALIADMQRDAENEGLARLIADCAEVGRHLATAGADDRLAGSMPFLTMLAVAVAGWQMERQGRIAADAEGDPAFLAMKRAAADYFVRHIVPEAAGLKPAALDGAGLLYAVEAEAFLA